MASELENIILNDVSNAFQRKSDHYLSNHPVIKLLGAPVTYKANNWILFNALYLRTEMGTTQCNCIIILLKVCDV